MSIGRHKSGGGVTGGALPLSLPTIPFADLEALVRADWQAGNHSTSWQRLNQRRTANLMAVFARHELTGYDAAMTAARTEAEARIIREAVIRATAR